MTGDRRTRGTRLAIGLMCMLAAPGAFAQLRALPPVLDLGDLQQGAVVAGRFELENPSATALAIHAVRFDCHCARARPLPRAVPAGGTVEVSFEVRTGELEGAFQKSVVVRYASPPRELTLAIVGVVHPAWWADALEVQLGSLDPGQTARREIALHVQAGKQIDFRLDSSSPGAVASLGVVREDGTRVVAIDVTIPVDARSGPFEAHVLIAATDAVKPSSTIRLIGHVEGDLRVEPRVLSLGSLDGLHDLTRRITVASRSGRALAIEHQREDAILLVEVEPGESPSQFTLVVTVPAGLAPGPYRGALFLLLDHPTEPRLRVPFAFQVVP